MRITIQRAQGHPVEIEIEPNDDIRAVQTKLAQLPEQVPLNFDTEILLFGDKALNVYGQPLSEYGVFESATIVILAKNAGTEEVFKLAANVAHYTHEKQESAPLLKTVNTQDRKETLREKFNKADVNQDQQISIEEAKILLADLKLNTSQLEQVFVNYDKDHSGGISFDEYYKAYIEAEEKFVAKELEEVAASMDSMLSSSQWLLFGCCCCLCTGCLSWIPFCCTKHRAEAKVMKALDPKHSEENRAKAHAGVAI